MARGLSSYNQSERAFRAAVAPDCVQPRRTGAVQRVLNATLARLNGTS